MHNGPVGQQKAVASLSRIAIPASTSWSPCSHKPSLQRDASVVDLGDYQPGSVTPGTHNLSFVPVSFLVTAFLSTWVGATLVIDAWIPRDRRPEPAERLRGYRPWLPARRRSGFRDSDRRRFAVGQECCHPPRRVHIRFPGDRKACRNHPSRANRAPTSVGIAGGCPPAERPGSPPGATAEDRFPAEGVRTRPKSDTSTY